MNQYLYHEDPYGVAHDPYACDIGELPHGNDVRMNPYAMAIDPYAAAEPYAEAQDLAALTPAQFGPYQRGIYQRGIFQRGIYQRGVYQRGIYQRGVLQRGPEWVYRA